jgi:hypothetical protein
VSVGKSLAKLIGRRWSRCAGGEGREHGRTRGGCAEAKKSDEEIEGGIVEVQGEARQYDGSSDMVGVG